MSSPLRDLPPLWRRRSVRTALAALPLLAAAAGSASLLEVPGYELSQGAALLVVLVLAPWLGLAAVRLERTRADPSVLAAWASASALCAALLAAVFGGSALRAAFGPCRALDAAAFFPVLALPSAFLGCGLATAAGFLARGRRLAATAIYAGIVASIVGARLFLAYRGPAAFLLDPLLGYVPGPLYDEAVPLDARLLLARTEALGWAAAVAGAAALLHALARRRSGHGEALRGAGVLAGVGLALAACGGLARTELQGGADLRSAIEARLGARRDGPLCTVFLPSEKPAAAAAELHAECEFHAADVAAILGITAPPHVTLYVYRSAEEKRQLVGASHTDFTRPWQAEIHLRDQPLPHPVLRHEMVHAIASALASGPLRIPARAGVIPSLALVEGLAVALESPRSGFTAHQWSRAARDLHLLPPLERILGPAGFWSQAPARAYTAAGSFLAYLLERYGPGPVSAAYRSGDLAAAFGRPLPELVREWQTMLDALPEDPGLSAAASRWLGRGSLFERRCAREAAGLLDEAARAEALGRTAEACRLYAHQAALDPAPDALLLSARALSQAGDLEGAEAALRGAAARVPPDDRARRAQVRAAEGDLRWLRDDLPGALDAWTDASRFPFQRAEARLLEVKKLAAAEPSLGPAVRAYLLQPGDASGLLRVARIAHPLAAYLVGRSLLQRGERGLAAAELARAAAADLPPLVRLEARLSLAEARCDPVQDPLLAALAPAGEADRARQAEASRRCAWERSRTMGSPPPTASPP